MRVMRKIVEPTIHIILWLTGYLLILNGANTLGVFTKADGSIFYPLTIGTIINIILFYTVSIYLIPIFSGNKKAVLILVWITFVFLVLMTIKSVIGYAFFTAKFSTFEEPFGSQLILNIVTGLIILSLAVTYGFSKNWFANERLKQKLKEEKLAAELNFLKAQINPHFLFNVLNTAFASATKSGDEITADIIEKLSGLMRYMLYESNAERVELEKEIDYLNNYIDLQKLRISKDTQLKIEFNVTGDIKKDKIAPLILVPFVENAFKHGISLNLKSFINIDLKIEKHKIICKIENSNHSKGDKKEESHSGIGLENVKKRMALIYPNSHKLNILEKVDSFLVELEITFN